MSYIQTERKKQKHQKVGNSENRMQRQSQITTVNHLASYKHNCGPLLLSPSFRTRRCAEASGLRMGFPPATLLATRISWTYRHTIGMKSTAKRQGRLQHCFLSCIWLLATLLLTGAAIEPNNEATTGITSCSKLSTPFVYTHQV